MNNVIAFYERQSGNYNGRNYDTTLGRLSVLETDSWRGIAPSTDGADYNPEPPIFTAKFANCPRNEHILAIANEDGKIALQDTNTRSTTVPESERFLTGQQCHYNAVFDLEWMPGHMKFISASGDHTAVLWEVREGTFEKTRVFNGHTRSVKTAAFRKTDSSVFATGGRDGAILIWDTRALNVGAMPRADNCIYSGHSGGPGTPQSYKRKTRQTPKLAANMSSSSITGLVFQDDNTLVSCGAGDGIIKVWDLRRNYTSYKKEPLPKHSISYPGTSTFKGYTNLMVDNSGVKLYVNCMDNNIYCYNLATYSSDPLIRYVGLRNSTFYIKSSLSQDGQYLLSGSSDEKAYIWNISNPQPLVALVGHTVEVTCVAWSHAADMRVVTCSDDARHKIWRIGPEVIENDELVNYRGQTEYCKDYRSNHFLRGRLKALESTPRSIKRLIEENETTPSSAEKLVQKRNFTEIDDLHCHETGSDKKRPHIESKGRRLFSPTTSTKFSDIYTSNLYSIQEDTEPNGIINHSSSLESTAPFFSTTLPFKQNTPKLLLSPPLSERLKMNLISPETPSPPSSASLSHQQQPSRSSLYPSVIFSPTSNLPNFVVNGEAPHLHMQSPKRKLKENVDWLTKIRKQKLMSSINSQFNEKINGTSNHYESSDICMSPRMYSLKVSSDFSPTSSTKTSGSLPSSTNGTPRRRASRSGSHNNNDTSPSHHKTPNGRRNSETTILRFFTIKTQDRTRSDSGATATTTTTATATAAVTNCSSIGDFNSNQ